uniref:Uncharacterized protein n=1 Tax=Arundo donax TaxID=35708 RepID=A0A0A9BZN5_ARUDO
MVSLSSWDGVREVHLGFLATYAPGFHVVCLCSFLGRAERADPDSDTLAWVSDFSCPFAPRAPPDPSILGLPLPAGGFQTFHVEFFWLP